MPIKIQSAASASAVSPFQVTISKSGSTYYATAASGASLGSNASLSALCTTLYASYKNIHLIYGAYTSTGDITPPANGSLTAEPGTTINFTAVKGIKSTNGNVLVSGIELMGKGYFEAGDHARYLSCRCNDLDNSWWGAFVLNCPADDTITDVSYIDCHALDCDRFGFEVVGDYYLTTTTEHPTAVTNCRWIGCTSINSGKNAQYMGSAAFISAYGDWGGAWETGFCFNDNVASIEGFEIIGCRAEGSYESGFHCEYGLLKSNITFDGCTAYGNGTKTSPDYGSGFLVGDGVSMSGCASEANKISGVIYHSSSTTPSGHPSIIECACKGNLHSALHVGDVNNTKFIITSENDARGIWLNGDMVGCDINMTISTPSGLFMDRNASDTTHYFQDGKLTLIVNNPTGASSIGGKIRQFKGSEIRLKYTTATGMATNEVQASVLQNTSLFLDVYTPKATGTTAVYLDGDCSGLTIRGKVRGTSAGANLVAIGNAATLTGPVVIRECEFSNLATAVSCNSSTTANTVEMSTQTLHYAGVTQPYLDSGAKLAFRGLNQIGLPLGNGSDVIGTGEIKFSQTIPDNFYIVRSTITCDPAATAVVDCWNKVTNPPTNGESITSLTPLTTAAGTEVIDQTLTNWTRTLTKGSYLRWNVDANDAAKRMIVSLDVMRF